ncbi:hypothetical protein PMG11_09406 [Penicillium brasilianum]|uniref:CENP-V/GFA domain-containing protein n=1 Tax=Penicillium brasilianum TaxID=104259 RepID=A0A0F7TZH3_PENBI|nr:hypothetical protein PMG11_09406 [Penicillium brasilianum]
MPKGSCLCHKVEYEFQGEPLMKGPCYCLSCRKISGSTNTLNLLLPDDKFSITSGSTKHHTEMHESGKPLTIYFCGDCGTGIYKTHELFPQKVVVLAGTLDEADGLELAKPEVELWTKYRSSWLTGLDFAEQKEEF